MKEIISCPSSVITHTAETALYALARETPDQVRAAHIANAALHLQKRRHAHQERCQDCAARDLDSREVA